MSSGLYRECRNCEKRFEISREWQVFCCNRCRKEWNYVEAGFCFYCGEPGDIQRDHVHPVAGRGDRKRTFLGQEIVFSCRECNAALGAQMFDGIELRVKWLIGKYKSKYKLNEGVVAWNDEEIGELGPLLRQRVKKLIAVRQRAERRVLYMEAVYSEMLRLFELEKEQSESVNNVYETLSEYERAEQEKMVDVEDIGK